MKLSTFTLTNKILNQPTSQIKTRIQKELQKPYRPIVDLFAKNQQEEHKKNTNSIKKVLKQLTDLKRQLKDIKNASKGPKISETLDMSQCRKNSERLKKSPESGKNYSKSPSSSKNKSNSQPKRDTSTQTLQKHREVNDFSFSIDSKPENKHKKTHKLQSQQQESQNSVQQTSAKKAMTTKRVLHKSLISPRKVDVEEVISSKVASLQANELYENNLNLIKLSSQTIQVSSPLFSAEDKLRLNIQIQRLAKNMTRIPIYFKSAEQYYEALQLYARSLNNQLNNFILILNRAHNYTDRLKEKSMNSPNKEEIFVCGKCEQNEKRGFEKTYRKQIKRYQKQLQRLSNDINTKDALIKQFKQSHENLVRQLSESREIWKSEKKFTKEQTQKFEKIRNELIKSEKEKQKIERQLQQKKNKTVQLQEDIKYYKKELQRIKGLSETVHMSQKNALSFVNLQTKNNQLQNLVKELKDKERLYQVIIQEKENIIKHLQTTNENHQRHETKYRNLVKEEDKQSIDSADYYKLKMNNEQLLNKIHAQNSQIYKLKQQNERLHVKIQNNSSELELCLAEIDKLYVQIGLLQKANQKYKDKCLKNRIVNEKKSKKETESQVKKGEAFQQINQLIKQHRQGIVKPK